MERTAEEEELIRRTIQGLAGECGAKTRAMGQTIHCVEPKGHKDFHYGYMKNHTEMTGWNWPQEVRRRKLDGTFHRR